MPYKLPLSGLMGNVQTAVNKLVVQLGFPYKTVTADEARETRKYIVACVSDIQAHLVERYGDEFYESVSSQRENREQLITRFRVEDAAKQQLALARAQETEADAIRIAENKEKFRLHMEQRDRENKNSQE